MMTLRPAALAVLADLAFVNVQAADDPEDHAAHHPAEKHQKAKAADAEGTMAMDKQMTAMHEMHEKMMAAKTPEDRRALMADHMKVMQDSMAMMSGMEKGGGGAPMGSMDKSKEDGMSGGMMSEMRMHHASMEKRVDMMTSMMQMMMDRMAAPMVGSPK